MTLNSTDGRFLFALVLINVAPLLVGFTLGISSSASAQLDLDPTWKSKFSSFLNVGGLIGCLLAGDFLDRFGRKQSIIYGGLFGIIGWIIMLLNKDVNMNTPETTLNVLIFGRTLTGISIGILNTAGLPYVIEITNPESKYKDSFPCTCQLALNFGTLIAYALGLYTAWWQTSIIILLIEIFLTIILTLDFIPESPKWLLKSNMRPEAENAYVILHSSQMPIQDKSDFASLHIKKDFFPTILDAIIPCRLIPSNFTSKVRIAMILIAGQQLTGINALMFYTELIFEKASDMDASLCAFYMILIQGIFSLSSLHFIDKYSRKFLLLSLGSVMGVCLLLFSIVNLTNDTGNRYLDLRLSGTLSLFFIGIYFIAFAISWGPLPMIVCLEMFPACYSGPISAAGLAINWTISFIVTNYFLAMVNFLGFGMTFLFYSISCFFCCWFVARFLPETSSKFSLPLISERII